MEVVSAVSVIEGVGMDPKVAELPCRTIVAKGNDIPDGASYASGVGSDCVPNVEGL